MRAAKESENGIITAKRRDRARPSGGIRLESRRTYNCEFRADRDGKR